MKNPKFEWLLVGIQFLLFGLYLIAPVLSPAAQLSRLHAQLASFLGIMGVFVGFFGLVYVADGIWELRKSKLRILPSPAKGAKLIDTGVYKNVRHPIYSGLVLMGLGFGLYTDHWPRLLLSLALMLLFFYKASYEENLLKKEVLGYQDYMRRSRMF